MRACNTPERVSGPYYVLHGAHSITGSGGSHTFFGKIPVVLPASTTQYDFKLIDNPLAAGPGPEWRSFRQRRR